MRTDYLEIVTNDVNAVCAAYSAAHAVVFSDPVAGLGNARHAQLADGALVGVRAPVCDRVAAGATLLTGGGY